MTAFSPALRKAYADVLSTMPELQREIFVRHAVDDVPLATIARDLRLSSEEVERHLACALVELDRQIGPVLELGDVAQRSPGR